MEELVFANFEDLSAVHAAGFDGVLTQGKIIRFSGVTDEFWYDEPEDWPEGFSTWWQKYGDQGLVLHWNPKKAEELGVWKNPRQVSWNWYPVNRWTPGFFQWWYITYQGLHYRKYLTAKKAYGTLQGFSGWDNTPVPGQALDYEFPSKQMLAHSREQFKRVLGKSFAGYIWYVWHRADYPDDLSRHPEWWPVNRKK
jgi:hypothetical protein